MAYWRLTAEGFGKIKHAEIELAPMTLFVGDNNSGKSYLLSLAWAIHALSKELLFSIPQIRKLKSDAYWEIEQFFVEMLDQVEKNESASGQIEEISEQIQTVVNQLLDKRKGDLIKNLFNSDCVGITRLTLTMPSGLQGEIVFKKEQEKLIVKYQGNEMSFINLWVDDGGNGSQRRDGAFAWAYLSMLILQLLDLDGDDVEAGSMVYLPAARTGFMLTKDIINKFARRSTYDIEFITDEKEKAQPFSRPIIEFLDVINELSEEQDGNKQNQEVVSFIQNDMIQGNVEIGALAGKELTYLPSGQNARYPFRATSAVVTELAPLLLLLEHRAKLDGLFYEEPEMCLHPALQKRMGQVLIKMVNAGMRVTATTHSDIILQHINNMVQLKHAGKRPKDFGYHDTDIIAGNKIRVYQFLNCADGTTEVKQLPCGENGFAIPTFNHALDDLMNEVIRIQE